MQYSLLGNTGLKVSRICFGTLTISPLQKNFDIEHGAAILKKAVEMGINFFDTADLYQTYPYLKKLLKMTSEPIIIASKSYDYTYQGMLDSIDKARRELDRDYLDIFLMHEQESQLTIKGHYKAWEALLDAKSKGLVKALGISTHHVAGVAAARELEGLDVIHPIVNYKGLGIVDGTITQMLAEINLAKKQGIGVYAMKPLGGGNLAKNYLKALEYAFSIENIDSVALGMQNESEIIANCMLLGKSEIPKEIHEKLVQYKKQLYIDYWCIGCSKCISKCSQGALKLNGFNKVEVDQEKCILCGYCSAVCTDFCIKMF